MSFFFLIGIEETFINQERERQQDGTVNKHYTPSSPRAEPRGQEVAMLTPTQTTHPRIYIHMNFLFHIRPLRIPFFHQLFFFFFLHSGPPQKEFHGCTSEPHKKTKTRSSIGALQQAHQQNKIKNGE